MSRSIVFPVVGRRLAAALLLGASLAPAACARSGRQSAAVVPEERTTVRVDNQGFLDMNVYVISGGARYRLGTATGKRASVFTIPASVVRMHTPLRFIADPIGGNRTPVSEEITVSPGDEVGLLIPSV